MIQQQASQSMHTIEANLGSKSPNSESHVITRTFTAEKDEARGEALSSDDEQDVSVSMMLDRGRRKRRRTMANAPVQRPNLYTQTPQRQPYSPLAAHGFFHSASALSSEDEDEEAHRSMMRHRRSIAVPDSDRVARQRCFDYLLMAIDAVWAEYCDSTSFAESQLYQQATATPCSPASENDDLNQPMSPTSPADPMLRPASMQPQCRRLMRLKKRLMDTKYALNDIVGNNDPDSSSRFWKSWDGLKHEVIEQVEGDDEDAIEVLEDLEEGRYY